MASYSDLNMERHRQRISRIVDEMTLFDDTLMSRVFADNIKATELMLRVILGRSIRVTKVSG